MVFSINYSPQLRGCSQLRKYLSTQETHGQAYEYSAIFTILRQYSIITVHYYGTVNLIKLSFNPVYSTNRLYPIFINPLWVTHLSLSMETQTSLHAIYGHVGDLALFPQITDAYICISNTTSNCIRVFHRCI